MTLVPTSTAGAFPSSRRARALSPRLAQGLVAATLVFAGAAGFLADGGTTAGAAVARAGGDLTYLLRAMAAIKAVMAAGAAAAVLWRLASPASWIRVVPYAASCGGMAAGPGLIWDMANVGLGALLLHAGLAATIILLWRDPAVGQRLSAIIAARRAALAR